MIMEHTQDRYCNTHGISHYLILAHVIQMLTCFHNRSMVSVTRVTRTALMNGGHPLTVQKLANEDVKTADAE
jgi:hypothetical protein